MKVKDLLRGTLDPPVRKTQKRRKDVPPGLIAEWCNQWIRNPDTEDVNVLQEHSEVLKKAIYWAWMDCFGQKRQNWKIRPSAQKCLRLEAFKKKGIFGTETPEVSGKFFKGQVGEAYTLAIAAMAGCNIHHFQLEVNCPGNIPGHIDALLTDVQGRLWVVDVKATTGAGMRYVSVYDALDDKWGYGKQLKTYAAGLQDAGLDIVGEVLVYLNTENWHDWKEVLIPPPSKQDRKDWKEWVSALKGCKGPLPMPEWARVRETTLLKPTPFKAEVLEDIRCQLCTHVNECWGEDWEKREGDKVQWIRKL